MGFWVSVGDDRLARLSVRTLGMFDGKEAPTANSYFKDPRGCAAPQRAEGLAAGRARPFVCSDPRCEGGAQVKESLAAYATKVVAALAPLLVLYGHEAAAADIVARVGAGTPARWTLKA